MLVPATRYQDCARALRFPTDVVGMEETVVVRDDVGAIVHAELRLGEGLFMFGPEVDNDFVRYMVAPRDAGRRETTTIYAIVADVQNHHARAAAAGAEIIQPLREESYGGWAYGLRDAEGHIWSFGSYDPRHQQL